MFSWVLVPLESVSTESQESESAYDSLTDVSDTCKRELRMIGQTVGKAGERPSERDRQRDATRQKIRAIALDAIGREGLDGVRMGDIAQLAGVSRGTVYFHYASMEDLAAEVLSEAEARIGQA